MTASNVDFLGDWDALKPYSNLDGNSSVHNAAAMQDGFITKSGFEAQVGTKNLIDASLLSILADYRRAVCRISCSGINFRGSRREWTGTGFLVGPNLLITNNHVINSEAVASSAIVDFEFERSRENLSQMTSSAVPGQRGLSLDPSRLFLTSSATKGLDYTFVWIGDEAAERYGTIPMSRGSFTGRPHDPIFVIHHPNGGVKMASVDDTELLNVEGDLLLYAADTEGGSSGAPIITRNGKLCGLHHAFSQNGELLRKHAARVTTLQDGKNYTIANEGIKFSAIAVDLENRLNSVGANQAAIEEVLSQFQDIDSLTGPYGVRGRAVKAELGQERCVIPAYNATEQDVDIAIWHMEWLNAHREDTATLQRTATAFADITQDIWVLDGISRETAEGLRIALKKTFEQDYRFAFADDETHPAQPLTALFYNSKSVEVSRKEWPRGVETLWRLKAKDDLEMKILSGPIFPSFPAWFDITVKHRSPAFNFNLVPLFVGNRGNASLRRAAAAGVMTRVVEKTIGHVDDMTDWLIVGDVNTPLRRTRLAALESIGFTPILALDRQKGGFSYLRSKGSIVSQLFVPKGTERIGNDEGIVTVVDRVFQGRFVETITSNAPYGVRISLFDEATARDLKSVTRLLGDNEFLSSTGSKAKEVDLFESADHNWQWEGLNKPQFMGRNASRLTGILETVNRELQEIYGASATPLSLLDLYVIIYCEVGFKNGVIDPDAGHSLGERGFLPLPSNLSYWIGQGAPTHDELLSLHENVGYYARYLGAIKNKTVRNSSHGMLYRDLFRASGIAGQEDRQAKLLAGIIHGYFLNQNYRDGARTDFDALMAAYRDDLPIDVMLDASGYVHAGSSILPNRQRNIEAAVRDHGASSLTL